MFWLPINPGYPSSFLDFTNEKLLFKYLEFLPKISVYYESGSASEGFTKFFDQAAFTKVLIFIQEEFDPYKIFQDSISNIKRLNYKCNLKSSKKQLLANDLGYSAHSREDIENVILKYYEALCLASSVERKAYCYQSIGFYYLQLRSYRQCLQYMQLTEKLITSATCPVKPKFFHSTSRYKSICEKYIQSSNFVKPLRLPLCDKSVNGVAQCINIIEDDSGKSFVYSTKKLKFGDVIAVTKSFESYSKSFVCCNCATMKLECLIPCKSCTLAVFCSDQCREEALDGFHGIECELIHFYRSVFDTNALLALKTTFKIMENKPKWNADICVGFNCQVTSILSAAVKEVSFKDAFVFSISATAALNVLRSSDKFKKWIEHFYNGEAEFINMFGKVYKAVCSNGFFEKVRHLDWIYGSMNKGGSQDEANVLVYRHEYSDDNYYIVCKEVAVGGKLIVCDRRDCSKDKTVNPLRIEKFIINMEEMYNNLISLDGKIIFQVLRNEIVNKLDPNDLLKPLAFEALLDLFFSGDYEYTRSKNSLFPVSFSRLS